MQEEHSKEKTKQTLKTNTKHKKTNPKTKTNKKNKNQKAKTTNLFQDLKSLQTCTMAKKYLSEQK